MNGTPERGERCACGCPTCEYCTFGWNQPKCESHHRTGRGKYADEICSDCDHDECELWAEAQTCQECAGTGREGGVKGGIEPSSPIPLADVPPSPYGSVFGTDAVCMPPVSAEPYRGVGRTGDCRLGP